MFSIFVFVNIFSICLLGFLTSFTDLKKGIIENRVVFSAIVIAVALNFLNGFDFFAFILNGFFAFLFGFLLWIAGLWSAGDSKLFLAFALLFPLPFFFSSSLFPALGIIINSFVPAFIAMLVIVLLKTNKAEKIKALKQSFEPRLVLSVAIFFFAFYWIFDLILSVFALQFDFFLMAIILFVVVSAVEFFLPKKSLFFFAAVSIFFLIFRLPQVLTLDFLLFFSAFLLLVLFLLFFVLRLGFSCFGRAKEISELRPGMVLLEAIVKRKGKIEKKKSIFPSLVNVFSEIGENFFVESGPRGLSTEDIASLKTAKKGKKLNFETILVQETLPFAPIIFFGTILSFFVPLFL